MKNWLNKKIELFKKRSKQLLSLAFSALIIYVTIRFDIWWITISGLIFYHICMVPRYWNNYLDEQRRKWKELESRIQKGDKVTRKGKFGIQL